jgi:hypothetical protein
MTAIEILRKYTTGEKTLEETNEALAAAGANFHLDHTRNEIKPEEVGYYGLLDTGTGSLDKVKVEDGHLVNADCGEMYAMCIIGDKVYVVKGTELLSI